MRKDDSAIQASSAQYCHNSWKACGSSYRFPAVFSGPNRRKSHLTFKNLLPIQICEHPGNVSVDANRLFFDLFWAKRFAQIDTAIHRFRISRRHLPERILDDALEGERDQLLTELADAVSETRTAADQAAELNEDGEAGLLRLTEIWCAMNGVPAIVIFEGGQSELLANVVAQIYAHLLQHPSRDPVGLAVYVELRYMTASLMLGEWFE